MTTGPENPYGEQDPGTPHPQPPPNPYQQQPSYQQPPYPQQYGQPYPQQPPYGYPVAVPTDGLAIGAMITGIAGLVMACAYGLGLLASPVALVLGKVSMNRIARSEGRLGGRGMALAGFILGIVGTALLVLVIIGLVIVIIVAANDDSSSTFGHAIG
jgi:hypothetical protein